MTNTPTTTTRNDEWAAPGPGAWRAETAHSVGAMTPVTQYVIGAAQPAAMRQVFAQWGIPADTTDVKFINGHMYHRLRPLVGADKPIRKPPPAAILKLLVRVLKLAADGVELHRQLLDKSGQAIVARP